MLILGIETSCDETSAAVVESGYHVQSCVIASSRQAFERSGGVIPEQAAREQMRAIHPVIDQALAEAGATPTDLDAIAVTRGPGLLGSLLVGTVTARTLASLWKKPLIGVHHTLGHLSSPWLDLREEPSFPLLTLSASGGHTELWLRTAPVHARLLGSTRDDAAGEAFDKGACMLGLPYPGGPAIAKAAESGNPLAYPFPHPLSKEETLDFSYSGLKTSLRYLIRDLEIEQMAVNSEQSTVVCHLAASYQHALCLHLTSRIVHALKRNPEVREIHCVGGVSANLHLRSLLKDVCGGRIVRVPQKILYCTDNAAMIAAAGTLLLQEHGGAACGPFCTAASIPASEIFALTGTPAQ